MKKTLTTLFFIFITLTFSLIAQTYILQPNSVTGKDSEIWSAGNANAGNKESINVYTWTNIGNLALKRSLLEFDLSVLPPDVELLDAKLSLFFNPTDPYEGIDLHEGTNSCFIERITSPWDEQLVTWANQPTSTSMHRVSLPSSINGTQNYININVTPLVADILEDPLNSHGFMLKMQNEINPYRMLIFASSDHPNPAIRPRLEVTVAPVTSTDELKPSAPDFEIYPNPANLHHSNPVILKSTISEGEYYHYQIIDAFGQQLQDGMVFSNKQTIDISNLQSAVYYLLIQNEEGFKIVKKMIILD